jgi:lipoic acid synthetase
MSADVSLYQLETAAAGTVTKNSRLPHWLKIKLTGGTRFAAVKSCIEAHRLHTVCVEARCPNRAECFSAGTATFLILGKVCTRECAFCGVTRGAPHNIDKDEPVRVAEAAAALRLRHIVITSVTRDDAPDGGASHFVRCVSQCRAKVPGATIELLIPDFGGNGNALAEVMTSAPDILNHNLETVPRLYDSIRPKADYDCSLGIIARARKSGLTAKSGIMVGLGETEAEIQAVLRDLNRAGCSIVTIGQYLQPTDRQMPVVRFETPLTFKKYERFGREAGIEKVIAGPFVRSSYRAHEALLATTYCRTVMI